MNLGNKQKRRYRYNHDVLTEPTPQSGSIFHRLAHGFVYGICVIYLGITPPPPEKELRFMAVVAVVTFLLATMGVLFGWFLIQMVFKR
jgi:hypothetical protein